jgi:phosphonate transport system permease protein
VTSVNDAPSRLPVPPRPRRRLALGTWTLAALLLTGIHALAWEATDVSLQSLVDGWQGMVEFLDEAVPPDLSWAGVVRPGLHACLQTLWIGLLGTTLSVPFALGLAIIGARNTTRGHTTYQLARSILSFLRAVPDVVFALIFVTAVGLGPFPGVLALVCHNTGVMGKLWSEAMEEINPGPVDALRVTGASNLQVAAHAVYPAVVPQLVGLLLYRFDVNVRSSLVLGLVGAGGIGFLINQSIQLFRFDHMLTYILMVLALIIAVDQLSALVRNRLMR